MPKLIVCVLLLNEDELGKALIVLVKDAAMLAQYVTHIPLKALKVLEEATRPTTIIYENAQNLAHNLIAIDGSIAIRIPQNDFCQALLQQFGKPIVSTSANIVEHPQHFDLWTFRLLFNKKSTIS